MNKAFVLFRDGRRLRAAHADLAKPDGPILLGGRRFASDGGLGHWCQLTDVQKRLVGFAIGSLAAANHSAAWRSWWEAFDNRELIDFSEASVFLADPMPKDYHNDCSLLIGGWVCNDGAGEFALVIPDDNGFCFEANQPHEFWKGIGFDLASVEVSSVD